jgi:glutamate formiminotransferase / formiminotetrahydrofolate cyclodeaminase
MRKVVECVPNISNGRDPQVYNAVADAARAVPGASVLDVDPGADTNRTVITIAGEPEAVMEAAFQVVRRASELIDMRHHHGAHPRHGATDVCPFVPVSNVTMDDCVGYANVVGKRIGEELGLPVWLYEYAASRPERRNLAELRSGEYEALPHKLGTEAWAPDYGPNVWDERAARTGVCTVGARKFLIAYNINFNTRNHRLVNDIALDIREKGRIMRDEGGKFVRDAQGSPVYQAGMFAKCKAMGWYIPAYNCAQLTMNLTDFEETPPHIVFDTVCDLAAARGLRVTGSELVGLIPLSALREAGRFFLDVQQQVCTGVGEAELIRVAVQTMGLDEVAPFEPRRRIIEYAIDEHARPLVAMSLTAFADELASTSPAPGGGSVAALAGAMAAGLAAMVPNLTVGKKGYKKVRTEMNAVAEEAQRLKDEFLRAIDDDTAAFNRLMECFSLPKTTPDEQAARAQAITEATISAIDVPLATLVRTTRTLELCLAAAQRGNQNSLSDSGVGGAMALACATGAYYNVLINLKTLDLSAPAMAHYAARTRAEADAAFAATQAAARAVEQVLQAGLV